MAQFTEHYGLHQWEPEDNFQREDFNEDFEKIEGAIQAVAARTEVVVGTYTGDGASSREIALGFQPKAVLLEDRTGERGGLSLTGGLAVGSVKVGYPSRGWGLTITPNGFQVSVNAQGHIYTNANGQSYSYLAFR